MWINSVYYSTLIASLFSLIGLSIYHEVLYFAKGILLITFAIIFGFFCRNIKIDIKINLFFKIGLFYSLGSFVGQFYDLSFLGWRYDTLSSGDIRVFNVLQYFVYLAPYAISRFWILILLLCQIATFTGTSTYLLGLFLLILPHYSVRVLGYFILMYLTIAIFSTDVCKIPEGFLFLVNDLERALQISEICNEKFSIFGFDIARQFSSGYYRSDENPLAVELQILNIAVRLGLISIPILLFFYYIIRNKSKTGLILTAMLINSLANPILWSFPFLYFFMIIGQSLSADFKDD